MNRHPVKLQQQLIRRVLARPRTIVSRSISTIPPAHRSRSWKSITARLGLAAGLIYWYNTSARFADLKSLPELEPAPPYNDAESSTIESITQARKERHTKNANAKPDRQITPSKDEGQSSANAENTISDPISLEEIEDEGHQEGAFNEETGEINWDCPCLGGMAHGPCGEHFRTAFSCFVFSKEEPKGMDCIDHFSAMQNCFRENPEIYGDMDSNEDDTDSESEEEKPDAKHGDARSTDLSAADKSKDHDVDSLGTSSSAASTASALSPTQTVPPRLTSNETKKSTKGQSQHPQTHDTNTANLSDAPESNSDHGKHEPKKKLDVEADADEREPLLGGERSTSPIPLASHKAI